MGLKLNKGLGHFYHSYKYTVWLVLILTVGLFFRTYKIVEFFDFAHDGDLYSWIVKDIVVDHHLRLIGQLTSAPGVYIGPLFYYSLIPFFLLTHMDPIGGVIPITILGMCTLLSFYIVFARLFNKQVALIITFLQAVLLDVVHFDRAVVPSTPTNIWVIWYFYVVVQISRGNYGVLALLGVLVGLIWHIHVALMPALIAIPAAVVVSRKLPSLKQVAYFIGSLFITSIPFLIFEIKHGFSQTLSIINNFGIDHGGGKGLPKLINVTDYIGKVIEQSFLNPDHLPLIDPRIIVLIIILSTAGLIYLKVLKTREVIPWLVWIVGVMLFYTISSTPLSEYYFANIEIIFFAIVSLWLGVIFKSSKIGKFAILALLLIILVKNFTYYITDNPFRYGYVDRKAAAQFIADQAKKNNFPCVAVSYITTIGENVGFRYFFWLDHLHVNQPKSGGPIYTIVIPNNLINNPQTKFGHIGVLGPNNVYSPDIIAKSCSGPDENLTDPMFGFSR